MLEEEKLGLNLALFLVLFSGVTPGIAQVTRGGGGLNWSQLCAGQVLSLLYSCSESILFVELCKGFICFEISPLYDL